MTANIDTEQLYKDNVLGNYGLPPISFVRGRGVHLWDDQGNQYLDFCSGLAVTTLGHCHPALTAAIQKQAETLLHVSNLYRNEKQALLARKLNDKAGGNGKVFFCNSGAEANEGLLKLSRLYGQRKAGAEGKCIKVVCAEKAFHGRTFGGMSATPKPKVQNGFHPLVPGFVFAELNNLESFANAVDDETSAVFIETIQGEGGIHPCEVEFLQGLRKLCDEKGVLLLLDEVQCGIARTGVFFAFEHAGVKPDAIGMAKGLGSGVPVGAIWIHDEFADLFTPGTHATTFGGTPLICAAALATLETIEKENIIENVKLNGEYLINALDSLQNEMPESIVEVRGRGYLVGIQISGDNLALVKACRDKGLIVPPAEGNVVRFLPPLIATKTEIDAAIAIFKECLQEQMAQMKAEATA